jgi:hypothetical protein
LRPQLGKESAVTVESAPAFISINGQPSQAYNESAFRYFLEIERRRAERSVRPLLLLLVKLKSSGANNAATSPGTFTKIFSVLSASVREVDFIGWYREGVVAAAVLAPSGPVSETVRHHLSARVLRALRERLSPDEAAHVAVRVIALGRSQRM